MAFDNALLPEQQSTMSKTIPLKTAKGKNHIHWIANVKHVSHEPGCGINALIDAAATLFASIAEIKQLTKPLPAEQLHHRLVKELSDFQECINQEHYLDETRLACRYIICSTLDDIIINMSWGNDNYWEEFNLIKTHHHDTANGKRFFPILERIQQEPESFIDLLEFTYLCLLFGYRGEYRNTAYGLNYIYQLTDDTYRLIRNVRGNFSQQLSPNIQPPPPVLQQTNEKQVKLWPLFVGTLATIAVIASTFNFLFNVTTNNIIEKSAQSMHTAGK